MSPSKPTLVLLHGWAVHSAIWQAVEEPLAEHFDLLPIDFPGYGTRTAERGDMDLAGLAADVTERVPDQAQVLAWSLGTIVALQAAIASPAKFASLTLISPTPRFLTGDDWVYGTSPAAMENLRQRFHGDYATALKRFLLLQAGMDATARHNAKATLTRITQSTDPSTATLDAGLDILATTDLRTSVGQITTSTQLIVCEEDRVIPAAAGEHLATLIPDSRLLHLPCGHAPMIECPAALIAAVLASKNKPNRVK